MGHCLTLPRRFSTDRHRRGDNIFNDLTEEESPVEAAMRILYQANDNDLTGTARMLRNSDNDLRSMLEYLQNCLPLNDPIMSSVAYIIIRESTLPSRDFLRHIADTLRLPQLGQALKAATISNTNAAQPGASVEQVDPELATSSAQGNQPGVVKKSRTRSRPGTSGGKTTPEPWIELIQARNSCLILDCLATRLCGPNVTFLLNETVMDFLLDCIKLVNKESANSSTQPGRLQVVLHALLAFEKFSQTRECQVMVEDFFTRLPGGYPMKIYESWQHSNDVLCRQVGFCAVWLMDNIFTVPNRECTYKSVDRHNLNAVLNMKDVSQYLKISPDGLEARCDSDFFESVRCTYEVTSGTFYYEVTLISAGIMQIGWATKDSPYLNHEGRGIGDDPYSIAYDGFRQNIWHDAKPEKEIGGGKWQPGDVVGCLLSVEKEVVIFYVNGKAMKKRHQLFQYAKSGFFAAASFLCNQQCVFNFGRSAFRYPPPKKWQARNFNDVGELTEAEKTILPRPVQMKQLQEESIPDNACTLCLTNVADAEIIPCNHTGFCRPCSLRLSDCPFCRGHIVKIIAASSNSGEKSHTNNSSHRPSLDSILKNPFILGQFPVEPETSAPSLIPQTSVDVLESETSPAEDGEEGTEETKPIVVVL